MTACVGLGLTLAVVSTAPAAVPSLLAPTTAHAQAADRNAEARVFFEKGNRLFSRAMKKEGERKRELLEEALTAYVSSLRIVRSRNALFNAAVVLEELGRKGEAFAYLTEYLTIPGLSEQERQEARQRRDKLRESIAVVEIESDPEGADVRVDRLDLASRGQTPVQIAVEPGQHTIYLTHEGYERGERKVTATRGETARVSLELAPKPVAVTIESPFDGQLLLDGEPVTMGTAIGVTPGEHTLRLEREGEPPIERRIRVEPGRDSMAVTLDASGAPGALVVVSNVAAEVHVDGALVGQGRNVRAELDPGTHEVAVRAAGRDTWEGNVRVTRGAATRLRVDLAEPGTGERTLGRWPLAVGLVAAGAGVAALGLSIKAVQIKKDYDDICPDDACLMGFTPQGESKKAKLEDYNLAADVMWGVTAAAGIAAIALWIANDEEGSESRSGASVAVTPMREGAFVQAELPLRGL